MEYLAIMNFSRKTLIVGSQYKMSPFVRIGLLQQLLKKFVNFGLGRTSRIPQSLLMPKCSNLSIILL
jgi:hypothetical protein